MVHQYDHQPDAHTNNKRQNQPIDRTKHTEEPQDAGGWAARAAVDYGHHSQAYQQDLAGANKYVQAHGFPDLQISGVQGHDLVGKDKKTGDTYFVGGDHPNGERVSGAQPKPVDAASGHKAALNADGSGTYTVSANDKTGHDLAKGVLSDRLKAAGVDRAPSENEIANFDKELAQLNGKHWDKTLRAGKELKVGATALGEGDPHKTILLDGLLNHKMEALKHPVDAFKQAVGIGSGAAEQAAVAPLNPAIHAKAQEILEARHKAAGMHRPPTEAEVTSYGHKMGLDNLKGKELTEALRVGRLHWGAINPS